MRRIKLLVALRLVLPHARGQRPEAFQLSTLNKWDTVHSNTSSKPRHITATQLIAALETDIEYMRAFHSQFWQRTTLSPSGRPVLGPGEYEVFIDDRIGLYQDVYKVKNHQSGRIYLTNKRVIYVKGRTEEKGLALNLHWISSLELYGGFLKSSPKLILRMKDKSMDSVLQIESQISLNRKSFTWICPICSYGNDMSLNENDILKLKSNLPVCTVCGVKSSYEVIDAAISETLSLPEKQVDLVSFDDSVCPNCTFVNHHMMTKCEMCGSALLNPQRGTDKPSSKGSKSTVLLETIESFAQIDQHIIKFSIKSGRVQELRSDLQEILALRNDTEKVHPLTSYETPTTAPSNGIHGLSSTSLQQSHQISSILGQSVQDLDKLISMAKELTILSRRYQRVLAKSHSNPTNTGKTIKMLQNSTNSVAKIGRIYSDNLIEKSITDDKTAQVMEKLKKGESPNGSRSGLSILYLDELARVICDYLISCNILDKSQGVVTLYEVFVIYNKSRRINLVGPEEVVDAMSRLDYLNLKLNLGKISHSKSQLDGTRTAATNEMFVFTVTKKNNKSNISKMIYDQIKSNPGLSIVQLQKSAFNMNYVILETNISDMVEGGELIIDKTLEGTTYWPNNILMKSAHDAMVQHINKTTCEVDLTQTPDISHILRVSDHDMSSKTFSELTGLSFH